MAPFTPSERRDNNVTENRSGRAVVIGAGVSGLVAARELVKRGLRVTVLEGSQAVGGMVRGVELGGIEVDAGAEAFATRTREVGDLCRELGLETAGPEGRSHIWWPDGIHPLARGVLGIPASLDDDAVAALTCEQRARATQDVVTPVDGIGATVAEVVTERLGPAVLERLVAPLTRSVFRMDPEAMALARFAPGLADAMREHGSLVRAVASLTHDRPAVEQTVGGMHRLVGALVEQLTGDGARIHTNAEVTELEELGGSGWGVETTRGRYEASRVVVAVPARQAAALLRGLGMGFAVPCANASRNVMFALDHPELRECPVGSGVIIAEPAAGMRASALTDYSAKWPWARRDGVHVVRLSLIPDAAITAPEALAEASRLLGVELAAENVRGHVETLWPQMPRAIGAAAREQLDAIRAQHPGLAVAGAWTEGTGLAAAVASGTRAAAE